MASHREDRQPKPTTYYLTFRKRQSNYLVSRIRKLCRRGLRGVKLVVSDAHEGIKAAVAKLMNAAWRRCRVHTMRNALAHAGKSSRRVVSAFMATA
jgi:transposase-like protein